LAPADHAALRAEPDHAASRAAGDVRLSAACRSCRPHSHNATSAGLGISDDAFVSTGSDGHILRVDGEEFRVHTTDDGTTHCDWLTGPNPG